MPGIHQVTSVSRYCWRYKNFNFTLFTEYGTLWFPRISSVDSDEMLFITSKNAGLGNGGGSKGGISFWIKKTSKKHW